MGSKAALLTQLLCPTSEAANFREGSDHICGGGQQKQTSSRVFRAGSASEQCKKFHLAREVTSLQYLNHFQRLRLSVHLRCLIIWRRDKISAVMREVHWSHCCCMTFHSNGLSLAVWIIKNIINVGRYDQIMYAVVKNWKKSSSSAFNRSELLKIIIQSKCKWKLTRLESRSWQFYLLRLMLEHRLQGRTSRL